MQYDYSYSYQSTDEEGHRKTKPGSEVEKEEMKAIIDKGQSGRYNGATRSQKRVVIYGRQQQQHMHSQIEYAMTTIETKYGIMGLKVQRATTPKESIRKPRLRMSKEA
jgi:ribosomal protein S3